MESKGFRAPEGRNRRLEGLPEDVPVGIIRTDRTGRCIYVNPRWCRMSGQTREEALGRGWIRAVYPADRKRVLGGWRKATGEGTEFVEEFRLQGAEGVGRVVMVRVLPLFEGGELDGVLGAVCDITEHQRSQQALRELTATLRERVKELNCLFEISHVMERFSGEDDLGQVLRRTVELLPPSWEHPEITCARIVMGDEEYATSDYADSPWKQTAEIVAHGDTVGKIEVCYLEERPQRDEGPFLEEERRLLNAVAERLGQRVERLRTQASLRQREQELRERLTHLTRVSLMGEMASSLAHEINQPLTAIATYAQACRRRLESGEEGNGDLLGAVERISSEALRAGDIVHRLRDLVSGQESKRVDVSINGLIRGIQTLASVDARLHDIHLTLDLADSLPPVKADGIQIQQVLLNLIRNAIDAMRETDPARREIVVHSELQDGGRAVEVVVSDNGCGVPQDADDRLFQPFFTTKKGGIGMGLSISQSIVQSHGGKLWYTPRPEGGTSFHFTVPVQAEESR